MDAGRRRIPLFGFELFVLTLGVIVASYSWFHHEELRALGGKTSAFCNISSTLNCDAVNSSEWSELFSVPLAAWGLAFYVALGILSFLFLKAPKRIGKLQIGAGIGALLFSIYLYYISHFEIGALCLSCMAMYGINIALFFVYLARARKAATQEADEVWWPLVVSTLPFLLVILFPHFPAAFIAKPTPIEADELEGPIKNLRFALRGEGLTAETSLGDPATNSKVIVEYFDYECPACSRVYEYLESLKADGLDFAVVYRHYPLDHKCNKTIPGGFHVHSCLYAEAARCANEQDSFAELHRFIFENARSFSRRTRPQVIEALGSYSVEAGLDRDALLECLESDRQMAVIQRDIADANAVGLRGTPTLWLNGTLLEDLSLAGLRKALSTE